MSEKRIIRAKDIVTDIRAGMTDHEIMAKYQLSMKGLESIFNKLEETGTVKRSELYGRFSSHDDTVNLASLRKQPRNYFALSLEIHEAGNPLNKGEIFDVSEKGVGVKGIEATPDLTLTLVIDANDVDDTGTLLFETVCRWTRRDEDGSCLAGFEILKISESDLTKLRKLIRNATLG